VNLFFNNWKKYLEFKINFYFNNYVAIWSQIKEILIINNISSCTIKKRILFLHFLWHIL